MLLSSISSRSRRRRKRRKWRRWNLSRPNHRKIVKKQWQTLTNCLSRWHLRRTSKPQFQASANPKKQRTKSSKTSPSKKNHKPSLLLTARKATWCSSPIKTSTKISSPFNNPSRSIKKATISRISSVSLSTSFKKRRRRNKRALVRISTFSQGHPRKSSVLRTIRTR